MLEFKGNLSLVDYYYYYYFARGLKQMEVAPPFHRVGKTKQALILGMTRMICCIKFGVL